MKLQITNNRSQIVTVLMILALLIVFGCKKNETSSPDPAPADTQVIPSSTPSETLIPTATETETPVPISMYFQDGQFPNASYTGTIDGYISSEDAYAPYGTCQTMITGPYTSGTTSQRRILIKFDLSALSSVTVVSAQLQLWVDGILTSDTVSLQIYRASSPWDEASGCSGALNAAANWVSNTASTTWTSPGGDYIAATINLNAPPMASSGVFTTYDIHPTVLQNWIDNSSTNYGFVILTDEDSTGSDWVRFATKENTTVNYRPRLLVKYWP